jgi:putative ABC transport system permease protein
VKYLPLVWFGIWRKPTRTTLILLQVAVAFALFGVLQGLKSGVEQVIANVRADLLLVGQSLESASPLPVAYAERLRSIPGVKAVTFATGLAGTYQKATERVAVNAMESNDLWQSVLPALTLGGMTVLPKDLHALQSTRTGALVTPYGVKKYGWRVGDRIPITSTTLQNDGSGTWVFDIVGMVSTSITQQAATFFANYAYVDEARALNKGTVNAFYVVASDPNQATAVSETIDRAFANSSSETTTQPLKVRAQQQLQQIGDLNFLIRAIVSVVLVALVFSIATMMMQTVRERTPELAVLKTLGFSDRAVFLLVMVEALIVCTVGALIGLALATRAFPFAARFVPGLSMPRVVIAFGLAGAVLISLLSVSLPASRAARLQLVDGLAGR